jgi:hypothetical protein
VTPSPQDFHDRAVAAADAEGRLPLPEQAMWEIFPFEPPRNGEGGAECWRCTHPDDDAVWANERWILVPFDRPRLPFAAMLMPRAHLNKFGDGGAHLHAFLLGRPAGLLQLRGSNLALWEEMFPVVPAADVAAVVAVAVDALADLGESRL